MSMLIYFGFQYLIILKVINDPWQIFYTKKKKKFKKKSNTSQ